MDATLSLVDLAGAVALLLWGVHMVQSGIQRAFGPHLRRVLARRSATACAAFLAGLGVTAVLQSSTATGLMVSGFAAGGLVDLVPALAVMLGANVGTTLIVQVLSFDISRVAPLFVLLGVMLFRRGTRHPTRDLGRVAIGLGLMLIALQQLLALITPYEDVPSLRMLLGAITTAAGDRRDPRRGADLGGAFERRGGAAGRCPSRRKGWCRRMPPLRWCSAPISAPRSTRCSKARSAATRWRSGCRSAIW